MENNSSIGVGQIHIDDEAEFARLYPSVKAHFECCLRDEGLNPADWELYVLDIYGAEDYIYPGTDKRIILEPSFFLIYHCKNDEDLSAFLEGADPAHPEKAKFSVASD